MQLLYFAHLYLARSRRYFFYLFFLFWHVNRSRGEHRFLFSPVEEGLVQFLCLGLGFDSTIERLFLSISKTSRFWLGLCVSSRFESVLLFVWVATGWLLYQEQCLGWCALRQARTTREPASPWKVRKTTTCVWCLNVCCDKTPQCSTLSACSVKVTQSTVC